MSNVNDEYLEMTEIAEAATFSEALGALEFDPHALKRKYDAERDKRLRADGNAQFVPTVDGKFASFSADPWAEAFTREPVTQHCQVMIAGGGFGGLLAGARLREAGIEEIGFIENGGDFGGTWYWNRYPGAMCDIEAHIYLPLLEELNYAPRHRYTYANEILEHSKRIANHYKLYDRAYFQTTITEAHWREERRHWSIATNRGDHFTADFFVLACGRQSLPKLPAIPGIDRYGGHAFHSSRWDYAYTGGSENDFTLTGLKDKRIAVVGTGATAIQIVPEVAKWARETFVVQRTPSSVWWRGQQPTGENWVDMSAPGWQKARRENFQRFISGSPQPIDDVHDGWTELSAGLTPMPSEPIVRRLGRPLSGAERGELSQISDYRVMNRIRARVDELVDDPETAEALKPWYRWMCKRPCFHDEYLQAFGQPNVHMIDTEGKGAEAFTKGGIMVAGREIPVDCVVFATGFEAGIAYTRLTGFELYGSNGIALSAHWRGGVRSLHGMNTDKFPNCYFLGGTAHSAAAVNAVHLLDEQANHMAYIVGEAHKRGFSRLEADANAVDQYTSGIRNSRAGKALLRLFLECTPGYYNAEGDAKSSDELFLGGRYGDGPLAFYDLLKKWRETGSLPGMNSE